MITVLKPEFIKKLIELSEYINFLIHTEKTFENKGGFTISHLIEASKNLSEAYTLLDTMIHVIEISDIKELDAKEVVGLASAYKLITITLEELEEGGLKRFLNDNS